MVTLGFSKYGHLPLEQVPIGMLRWCVKGDVDRVEEDPWLKHAILEEIARHPARTPPHAPDGNTTMPGMDPKEQFRGIVKRTYRRTAPQFHPDRRGGSDKEMIAVNTFRDALLDEIDATA